MKAIVLAAGRGSRLAPMTNDKPKCLVTINGKTLLERCITSLRQGGALRIGIVGGYRAECVEPYAEQFFFNPSWNHTGIFESLRCAHEWLSSETCLVAYSDIFFGPKTVSAVGSSKPPIVIAYDPNAAALWRLRSSDPLSDFERFKMSRTGFVTEIGGRAQSMDEVAGQYMGLLKIAPEGWRSLQEAQRKLPEKVQSAADMTSLISIAIGNGTPVYAVATNEPWGEVDTVHDLQVYEQLYPQL